MTAFKEKISKFLFEPKDIATLVVFRIAFGAIMLWEVVRYFEGDRIRRYYVDPVFNFPYEGFEWVTPFSAEGMNMVFYLIALLSIFIMLGLFYRVSTVLMFIAFTYVYLLEEARYLNHFYLVSLISFLLIFIPAHKNYSLDSQIWKKNKSQWVPAWSIMLIQFQLGVAYFFGGVAKINYDWLMLAEPMQHWLIKKQEYPLIGQFFDEPWMAYSMSWSGMLLDLLAPLLLIFRRTRPFIFLAILVFHTMNDRLFTIGIFPWFMMIATVIFFPPDLPKRLWNTIINNYNNQGYYIVAGALIYSIIGIYFHREFELLPFVIAAISGALLVWSFIDFFATQTVDSIPKSNNVTMPVFQFNYFITGFIFIWAVFQIGFPLRHFFIPGNVSWTEEGHRFSWHMKLRSKSSELKFYAYIPGTDNRISLKAHQYLTDWQFEKMSTRPYMIRQFAQYLHNELKKKGKGHFEVRVECYSSLNYRPHQLLIDPKADLARVDYSNFSHNEWILQYPDSLNLLPDKAKSGTYESDD